MTTFKKKRLLNQLKEKKMKTMIYNIQKRIVSATIVLVIATFGFAASKAEGTPTRTTHNNTKAVAANTESVNPSGANLAVTSSEANTKELSLQFGEWMSDGSYWGADNSSDLAEKVLSEDIESWIENGSYWTLPRHGHKAEARLTHKIKHWMNNESYWGDDEN